jgi:hypothetical protein
MKMKVENLKEILESHKLWVEAKDGIRADLRNVDLSDANLGDANLGYANLRGADLRDTNLHYADLSGADLCGANLVSANLPTIPIITNIHQEVYAAASVPGALDMCMWHTCDTTHCRAGWIISLAGAEGVHLEQLLGSGTAAAMIYMASDPNLSCIPNWYDKSDNALVDMKRLAELEAAR